MRSDFMLCSIGWCRPRQGGASGRACRVPRLPSVAVRLPIDLQSLQSLLPSTCFPEVLAYACGAAVQTLLCIVLLLPAPSLL